VIREARPAPGTTWVQSSTVGIEGAARTAEVAGELGLVLVDAPVLGTRQPAEEGALVVLASGPDDVRDRLTPVFDAIGSKTLWLGAAGDGSRLKLACNAYLVMVTAGAAQSVALTRELGLAPEDFLAALEGGPLDSPYLRLKAANMIKGEHPASFGLTNATKDARLILDALHTAHVADRLDVAVVRTMEAAIGRLPDPEAADVSAVIEGLVPDQV
jgi:3-hydroxyisobutyrate dehydrogenase